MLEKEGGSIQAERDGGSEREREREREKENKEREEGVKQK